MASEDEGSRFLRFGDEVSFFDNEHRGYMLCDVSTYVREHVRVPLRTEAVGPSSSSSSSSWRSLPPAISPLPVPPACCLPASHNRMFPLPGMPMHRLR